MMSYIVYKESEYFRQTSTIKWDSILINLSSFFNRTSTQPTDQRYESHVKIQSKSDNWDGVGEGIAR